MSARSFSHFDRTLSGECPMKATLEVNLTHHLSKADLDEIVRASREENVTPDDMIAEFVKLGIKAKSLKGTKAAAR